MNLLQLIFGTTQLRLELIEHYSSKRLPVHYQPFGMSISDIFSFNGLWLAGRRRCWPMRKRLNFLLYPKIYHCLASSKCFISANLPLKIYCENNLYAHLYEGVVVLCDRVQLFLFVCSLLAFYLFVLSLLLSTLLCHVE